MNNLAHSKPVKLIFYNSQLVLLGPQNLQSNNGLDMWYMWGRHKIHTEFWWQSFCKMSTWKIKNRRVYQSYGS